MQERPLNFKRNEDTTLVVLNEKQAKDFQKASDDLRFAMATLHDYLKEGKLEEGLKHTICSLIENHVHTVTKTLGYSGVLESEKEERHAEIRQLNTDNRELRKQLGEKNTPEDVRESLKNLADNFKRWWNIEGFGHISDESFGGYGFKAKLSGMITDAYYAKDSEYIDEEQKVAKLKAYGFYVFGEGIHSRDYKVSATDANLKLIEQLLKSKYPSVQIFETKIYNRRNTEAPEIRDIEIFISNFDELFENK